MSDYTIYLTDDEAAWIEKRQEESDANSRSEVIRNALAHYRESLSEAPANE